MSAVDSEGYQIMSDGASSVAGGTMVTALEDTDAMPLGADAFDNLGYLQPRSRDLGAPPESLRSTSRQATSATAERSSEGPSNVGTLSKRSQTSVHRSNTFINKTDINVSPAFNINPQPPPYLQQQQSFIIIEGEKIAKSDKEEMKRKQLVHQLNRKRQKRICIWLAGGLAIAIIVIGALALLVVLKG